jgi:hypothetical protein
MRPTRIVTAIAAALALAIATPTDTRAQWVNTGSINSAWDPVWSVSWRAINGATMTSGSLSNAATLTSFPSVWNPNLPDSRWIAASPSGSLSVTGGTGTARVEYLFSTTFVATTNGVVGRLAWDNLFMGAFLGGTIDQNGQLVGASRLMNPFVASPGQGLFGFCRDGDGFLPGSSYPNCTMQFLLGGLEVGQTNRITFVLHGDGNTDGLFMTGANVVIPEPSTLLLTGSGLAGVGLLVRGRRRTTR